MRRLGPLEGRVATNNGTASFADLVVIVVMAFVLLTGLDFLGAGHHIASSTGAVTVQKTSSDDSRHWSGKGEGYRGGSKTGCRNCGNPR